MATASKMSYRAGAELTATSGDPVANAYKYPRIATFVRLVRRAGGWYVSELTKATIWANGGGEPRMILSTEQDIMAVKALMTNEEKISRKRITRIFTHLELERINLLELGFPLTITANIIRAREGEELLKESSWDYVKRIFRA